MKLRKPESGLVIRYAYLWRDDALVGREEGSKDRPCAIVLAVRRAENGEDRVLVAPITHSPPHPDLNALEIPAATALRLGLDVQRSWLLTHELNSFVWPGPDLRPSKGKSLGDGISFGYLPKALTDRMLRQVGAHRLAGKLKLVSRDQ